MEHTVSIGQRTVGHGRPAFLVAELSGNHNGSRERALELVRAAAAAGVDAIKLQTYTPDTLTIDCAKPDFVVPGGGPWGADALRSVWRGAHAVGVARGAFR